MNGNVNHLALEMKILILIIIVILTCFRAPLIIIEALEKQIKMSLMKQLNTMVNISQSYSSNTVLTYYLTKVFEFIIH